MGGSALALAGIDVQLKKMSLLELLGHFWN